MYKGDPETKKPPKPPSVNPANGRREGVQDGGLTWHYVLHVILLLATLLLAQTHRRRHEHHGTREGHSYRRPRQIVRPVVPYR